MFTEPFNTSLKEVPNLKDKLKGFNYHEDVVFHFKKSGIVYVPLFNVDVPTTTKSTTRFLNNLRKNIKCILIYSTRGVDSFGLLLRDENGMVKEIGPVKSNKQYLQSVLNKLNTENLELFAE